MTFKRNHCCGHLVFVSLVANILTACGLQCYDCSSYSVHCQAVTCGPGQACFSAKYSDGTGIFYNNGCVNNTRCNTGQSPEVVGRRFVPGSDAFHLTCLDCCHGDLCNSKTCVGLNTVVRCDDRSPTCSTWAGVCHQPEIAALTCQKTCNLCPSDGQWGDWGTWSECTDLCPDRKTRIRARQCDNPSPNNGGLPCLGTDRQEDTCGQCSATGKVDGHWSEWSQWGACNATCGTSFRVRTCSNPVPQNGGQPCRPADTYREDRSCHLGPCPVDGNWSDWSPWLRCSVTCGGGIRNRIRTCSNPAPAHGGLPCTDPTNFHQVSLCNEQPCI